MLVKLRTSLNFVKWDNDVLEEDDVLFTEGHGKTTNDTCQNIKKLGSTIEFMVLMNESKEALIH